MTDERSSRARSETAETTTHSITHLDWDGEPRTLHSIIRQFHFGLVHCHLYMGANLMSNASVGQNVCTIVAHTYKSDHVKDEDKSKYMTEMYEDLQ
ncbi:hypothetical protein Mapa_005540 [Marchantia paleacea]|nr:hypothetical protein Mapa_005540 [Marchantia paleacea]